MFSFEAVIWLQEMWFMSHVDHFKDILWDVLVSIQCSSFEKNNKLFVFYSK